MNAFRPVLVTRRYWPLVGGAETAMANLARGLRELGALPRIVTACQDARWPPDVVCREVPVHRVALPRFRWGLLRFLIGLSRYVRRHAADIDLVCVSRWNHEARAVVKALAGTGIPVVIRAEADDTLSQVAEGHDQRLWSRGGRDRCLRAQAVVATTPDVQQRLAALGMDPHRTCLIANGVAAPIARSPARRAAARRALATVNEDLRVPAQQPVALCLGRLHRENSWHVAVTAWQAVARQWPFARLWIVGDGPQRDDLYQRIRAADLVGRVVVPGEFDSTDELLLAADLLVAPTPSCKQSQAVLEALAAGLPVVVTAESGHGDLVTDGVTGHVIPGRDPARLADAICTSFRQPRHADAAAAAARRHLRETHSLQAMAAAHLRLFRHLVASTTRSVP